MHKLGAVLRAEKAQRCDGDAVVPEGIDIRSTAGINIRPAVPYPVVITPPVIACVNSSRIDFLTQPRYVYAFYLSRRQGGHVQVQQHFALDTLVYHVGSHLAGYLCASGEMRIVEGGHGNGDGGNAVEESLQRGAHGAGQEYIVAAVRPLVDARHQQVDAFLHHHLDGQYDAVGRSALHRISIDAVNLLVDFSQPDGVVKADGGAHTALLAVRRDHRHLPQVAQLVDQRPQAFGIDAVIIGNQDIQTQTHRKNHIILRKYPIISCSPYETLRDKIIAWQINPLVHALKDSFIHRLFPSFCFLGNGGRK